MQRQGVKAVTDPDGLCQMRAWMRQWGEAEAYLQRLQRKRDERYEEMRMMFEPTCVQRMTGMPRGGQISDSTATTVMRGIEQADACWDAIQSITRDMQARIKVRHAIDEAMEYLCQAHRDVLDMRYRVAPGNVAAMTFPEIAQALGCEERQAQRIESKSLQDMTSFVVYYLG